MGADRVLQVRVVDVFTQRPFAGNPLGVVLGAQGLDDARMQAVAREFNLSETTFVLPPTEAGRAAGADYRMRIFTPASELPFAGHPSVGTAFLLAEEGILPLHGARDGADRVTTVRQEITIGVLPLDIHADPRTGRPARVVMTQGRPALGEIYAGEERDALLAALGLTPGDLRDDLPVRVSSTGIRSVLVPLRDLDALARIRLDARAFGDVRGMADLSGVYAFVLAVDAVRSRDFAPHLGVPEDPATGSAAGALGAYLYAHDALPRTDGVLRFAAHQGVEMGRPSIIDVEAHGDGTTPLGVRVGGAAVTVTRGEMRV